MSFKKLVYLAPLKWKSYSQRPHFMMRYLADTLHMKILWVEPFPARLPKISDFYRRRDVYNQGTEEHQSIEVYSHCPLPIEPLVNCHKIYQKLFLDKMIRDIEHFVGSDEAILGFGKPSCLAKTLIEQNSFCYSFYDAMDDYPEFHTGISRHYIASIENDVARNVDQVFASSHFLRDKFAAINNNVSLVQNGYDGSNSVLDDDRPALNENVDGVSRRDQKVAGYVGTIYHWFDWELVIAIARLLPDVIVKLVGPVLGAMPGNLPSNIIMVPPCSNDEALRHMKSFDVGLIPFIINKATRAVDPIKYYEYRALGLPVISTLFGDMKYKIDDPGLLLVKDSSADKLMLLLAAAFEYNGDDGDFSFSLKSTWESRFRNADILGQHLERRRSGYI